MLENERLEDLKLDELSLRLEAIEKDNEQTKRENQLFASYILRRSKDDKKLDEDPEDQKAKNKNRKKTDASAKLSSEHKYFIANMELDTLKHNIEEGREKSETLLERLKAILEGTDLSIAEIRKEAFDFGRFLSAAENGRTGKYDAEKLTKYMDDKFKAKAALIDKLSLKNVSLKNQIVKAEAQIRHKDDAGDDLKFIDFHQLQIENKKSIKDIELRNNQLLMLKTNAGKVVQTLQSLKTRLNEANSDEKTIQTDMDILEKKREKSETAISNTEAAIKQLKNDTRNIKDEKNENADMPDPFTFVEQKIKAQELKKVRDNFKRKIEIASVAAKKARAVLRQSNNYINDIDMGDMEYAN